MDKSSKNKTHQKQFSYGTVEYEYIDMDNLDEQDKEAMDFFRDLEYILLGTSDIDFPK